MIPDTFIQQWQTQAPWQSLSMVEHDLIISRSLLDLFKHKTLQQTLVFRGGTALNKLYINPPARYSEDIDLVQIRPGPIGPIINAIRDSLNPWLGEPKRKLTERSAKLIYRYITLEQEPAKLKIEINTTEHFHVRELKSVNFEVFSEWCTGEANIVTYDFEELMATKIKALYQRRKGRDLFDVWYALKQNLIDVSSTIPIFRKYCEQSQENITRALFEKSMTLKRMHKDFQLDMGPLLSPSIHWNFEEAYELVWTNIISNLPGSPWKGEEATKNVF